VQRKNIKAAVEISGVGRGRTTIKAKRDDRSVADWLATAAITLQLPRHGRPANLRQFMCSIQERGENMIVVSASLTLSP
jgi:hypothetical protein